MNAIGNSYETFGLHLAAVAGDDNKVRYALRSGADVNAPDATGKTALMCAIAGENWQSLDPADASFMNPDRVATIRTLLTHPKISLLSLNAPHASMNGVVPLGMAAWLNMPRVVRLLLEESADAVSVDAMDSHGATALMYAARDGNLEVVQILLAHGARPDFRDNNYRTSIQFSLPHPSILWSCETVLKRHRWRESRSADRSHPPISEHILHLAAHSLLSSDDLEPPPAAIFNPRATSRLVETLVSSIRAGDLDFLHSLLFSPAPPTCSPSALYPMSVPVLVNVPDSKGWSLIHHALSVQHPSKDILDSLYCAGADMALFTTHEQWTPLHILAQYASVSPSRQEEATGLYQLVNHLIRELRAPLSARDKNDETCIHIAAEHGHSLELLTYLIDCDKSGTVRNLKNSRGLTPRQVAKPHFLAAFMPDPITSGTNTFAKISNDSSTSFATFSESSEQLHAQDDSSSICSPSDVDAALISQVIISNLRLSSPEARHVNDPPHVKHLENILAESRQHQETLVQYFRHRLKEADDELQQLRRNAERIDSLRGTVANAAAGKLTMRGIRALPLKVYHRDSEDSQNTAVSNDSRDFSPMPSPISDQSSVAPPRLRVMTLSGRPSAPTFTNTFQQDSPSSYLSPQYGLDHLDGEGQKRHSRLLGRLSSPDLRQKKHKDKTKEFDYEKDEKLSGTMRFKAWLKKIVVPHQQDGSPKSKLRQLPVVPKVNIPRPPTILVSTTDELEPCDTAIDTALRTSVVVLDAVERDLCNIYTSLNSAEQFIGLADHSITKVERAMKRAFKKRQQMIAKLRAAKPGSKWQEGDLLGPDNRSQGFLGITNAVNLRPSIASISSIQSSHSSVMSAAATVTEHDDEDTRVIRRLLLRKIEAQTSGTWEELEKAVAWLRIVKEVVRGIKRRAYL